MLSDHLKSVRPGLALALLTLLFGIFLGVAFGINEDNIKDGIKSQVSAHADQHKSISRSSDKIWRYLQRAHFHATGIGAFTLGLVILSAFTGMRAWLKMLTSLLIGLGGVYALAWFNLYHLSPSIGTEAAHHAFSTELAVYTGVGGLLSGMALLILNLLFGVGNDRAQRSLR